MKLYRHYKQKYYKLHTMAKHSETLEDLAYYECLYPNPSGQYWVRPTGLFFGTTEFDGKPVQRFQEVELQIESIADIDEPTIARLKPLNALIFGTAQEETFYSRINNRHKKLLLIASLDDTIVGFKLGYEEDLRTFYSWLGGVHPDFRRLGIAGELMKRQHHWCLQNGYQRIRTKSQIQFKGMIHLNLIHGFDIIGTETSSSPDSLKVLFQKDLRKENIPI